MAVGERGQSGALGVGKGLREGWAQVGTEGQAAVGRKGVGPRATGIQGTGEEGAGRRAAGQRGSGFTLMVRSPPCTWAAR